MRHHIWMRIVYIIDNFFYVHCILSIAGCSCLRLVTKSKGTLYARPREDKPPQRQIIHRSYWLTPFHGRWSSVTQYHCWYSAIMVRLEIVTRCFSLAQGRYLTCDLLEGVPCDSALRLPTILHSCQALRFRKDPMTAMDVAPLVCFAQLRKGA